jgi:predicted PurR-regulated permease PerM
MGDEHRDTTPLSPAPQAVAPRRLVPQPLQPEHLYKFAGLLFLLALLYRYFPEVSRVLLLLYAASIVAVAMNALVRRLPVGRKAVTAGIAVAILGGIALVVWFGVPALVDQVRGLSARAPEMEVRLRGWETWARDHTGLNVRLVGPGATEWLRDTFLSTSGGGGTRLLGRAQGLMEVFAIPFFLLIAGLFAVASPNRHLLDGILRAAPRDLRPAIRRILALLAERILGWLRGTLIGMACVFILSFIFFRIIGVPNALLLALFSGLMEFIPLVGPLVGGVVAAAIAFLADPTKGMWTAVAALAVQQIENHLIIPFAMSRTADVHPVVTLFALMLFGSLFGFLGVVLAIPLVMLVWTVIQVLWVEHTIDTDRDHIAPVVQD